MQTIRLRVSEKVFGNLMKILAGFRKDDLEVISENEEYLSIQKYLKRELDKIKEGKATYFTLDELDNELEDIVKDYENKGN